jgi:hypothetical protein
MLSILDPHSGRLSRREWLRIGGLGCLGVSLPEVLQSQSQARDSTLTQGPFFGRANSCIFIFLSGGHPQHETFDPKPDAPVEMRGPFQPIDTNVPGVRFCELLPRTARVADRLCILRSLATDDNTHGSSAYYYYTGTNEIKNGLPLGKTDRAADRAVDWPSIASVVGKLRPSEAAPFSSALIPELILNNPGYLFAGQNGGFMGRGWDPQVFPCDPTRPNYEIESLGMAHDVSTLRLSQRRSLLTQLTDHFDRAQRSAVVGAFAGHVQQAFDLLMSGPARAAFDLSRENDKLRDLYGRNKFGQSLLLARRLIEAGTRFVQVNWPREPGDLSVGNPVWDTHFDNTGRCRDTLCPPFDLGFSTLIDDLDQRGLLAETLIVVLGDFGRTPKINANGGRDHWGPVMSGVLAGAGISAAQVVGASDRNGAYPSERRMQPEDLSATIFYLLGIDPHTHIEVAGRPFKITTGRVITEALGSGPATADRVKPGGRVGSLLDFNRGPLSNGNFQSGAPLKGRVGQAEFWTGSPHWNAERPGEFSVASRVEATSDSYEAQIGFGVAGSKPAGVIAPNQTAMLAQEIYNQRPGRYTFVVRFAADADEETAGRWSQHFRCRIALLRFTDLSRDFTKTAELAVTEFDPPFNREPMEVKASRLLKDQQGGAGELLKGIGAVVTVQHRGKTPLDLAAAELKPSALRIQSASVRFLPRDFNFAHYDRDQEGKISRREAPPFLERCFEELDANRDGFITPDELDA